MLWTILGTILEAILAAIGALAVLGIAVLAAYDWVPWDRLKRR